MEQFLYRFRPADALLDRYEELEKQEIYFAPPEELNDPVEGYKDIFWSGDEIAWRNLLRHYLLCLKCACALAIGGGDGHQIDSSMLPILMTDDDLPAPARAKYQEICKLFFEQEAVSEAPKLLASRTHPVRRNELSFYLRQLHGHALQAIFTVYKIHNFLTFPDDNPDVDQVMPIRSELEVAAVNELELKHADKLDATERLFTLSSHATQQVMLLNKYNNPDANVNHDRVMLLVEYPEMYLKNVDRIIHGKWFTACFMANCRNPSVWSHYGDAHKGICLKFRTNLVQDVPSIKLHGITVSRCVEVGKTDLVYGDIAHHFYKVYYAKRYPEIDFFRSIAHIPIPALNSFWYSDGAGNRSACMDDMAKSEEEWRKRYWNTLYKSITTKLCSWSYEDEYRLVITSLNTDYSPKERRKLKYKFGDLDSIIFGINTSEEVKLRVTKIIENKCRSEGRRDFKFYQSYYAKDAGEIEVVEMTFLQFAWSGDPV